MDMTKNVIYTNFKDYLLIYKCLFFNRNNQKKFNRGLKKEPIKKWYQQVYFGAARGAYSYEQMNNWNWRLWENKFY